MDRQTKIINGKYIHLIKKRKKKNNRNYRNHETETEKNKFLCRLIHD